MTTYNIFSIGQKCRWALVTNTKSKKSRPRSTPNYKKYIEMTNVKLSISTLTLIQMSMVKWPKRKQRYLKKKYNGGRLKEKVWFALINQNKPKSQQLEGAAWVVWLSAANNFLLHLPPPNLPRNQLKNQKVLHWTCHYQTVKFGHIQLYDLVYKVPLILNLPSPLNWIFPLNAVIIKILTSY